MKILVIPDSHTHIEVIENGLELAKKYKADKIVMLGDYFDDWGATDQDQWDMLSYLKDLLRHRHDIVALMGNHELSYMGYPCSGYNRRIGKELGMELIKDFRFWSCYAEDGVLYSHAGATLGWLQEQKLLTVNETRYALSKRKGANVIEEKIGKKEFLARWDYTRFKKDFAPLRTFDFLATVSKARGGNSPYGSILWADLTEVIADEIPTVKQVVGHTPVSEIQCIGNVWFTDVFSNGNQSDEYLLVNNGRPEVVHYSDIAMEEIL